VNVGQGDCTIIQLPDGRVAVIDGGEAHLYWKSVKKYIDTRIKPKRFDYVINTHPHSDHLTGLLEIMNTYKWDTFVNYTNFKQYEIISGAGYKIMFHSFENNIEPGENPDANMDVNEISPIITVEYGTNVFVITGDAGFQKELDFTRDPWAMNFFGAERNYKTYLQIGHHGSNNSTAYFFLDFIKPDFAVIPNGTTYPQGIHWAQRRLEEYAIPFYTTRDHGNIVVQFDANTPKWYFAFDNPPNLRDIWILLIFSIVVFSFTNTRYCGEKLLTYHKLCNNI
jgi:competence protein ComEC